MMYFEETTSWFSWVHLAGWIVSSAIVTLSQTVWHYEANNVSYVRGTIDFDCNQRMVGQMFSWCSHRVNCLTSWGWCWCWSWVRGQQWQRGGFPSWQHRYSEINHSSSISTCLSCYTWSFMIKKLQCKCSDILVKWQSFVQATLDVIQAQSTEGHSCTWKHW